METEFNKTTKKDILMIDPRSILVNQNNNPRKIYGDISELKESIAANGVKDALKIKNTPDGPTLCHGYRRMYAVMELIEDGVDIARVPCLPVPRNYSDDDILLDHILCNSGKPLTPIEEANTLSMLISHGYTQAEVAAKLGKTQSCVSNTLKLANTTKQVQKYMNDGTVSATTVIRLLAQCKENQNMVEQKLTSAVNALTAKGKKKVIGTAVTEHVSKQHKQFEGWLNALREHNADADKIAKAEQIFNLIETATDSNAFIDSFLGLI